MTRTRRIAVAGAAALALAGIGLGVAGGVDDEADERATGPAATVVGVERDDEGGGAWEAEVRRPDGTVVEVHLGADLRSAGAVVAGDDD